MLGQIIVRPIVNALKLFEPERVIVFDIKRRLGVKNQILVLMPAQIFRVKAKIFRIKFPPLFLPPLILLGRDRRMDEVLHFHLFELARAEDELARRDLIAKGLADLRDTKRHTHARGVKDVFEVYVNSLTCLTAQISRLLVPIAGKVAKVGLNEQIKTARL